MDVRDKTVIVTGGATGIGLATVRKFCAAGAIVALNHLPGDDRGSAAVETLLAAGHRVVAAPGNVGVAGEAEDMIATAIKDLGSLDFLVNNAGTPGTSEPIEFKDLDRLDEDFWETILTTNLKGPFRCARAAAAALRDRKGAIVNTASVAGVGLRGSSIAYAASKAGLVNMTTNLARALAPDVRVNAVAPGLVDSPWIQGWPEARRQATLARSLVGRICQPDDIADAIFFLCTGTRMINGQTIVIDGGLAL
jgi:3-oxoacyl-[acyl-carrier protein] reductase